MKTWLVIDVSYLCHRAFHTSSELSWQGRPTGVVFQFLKSITSLKDDFQTDRIAFCFEHPHLFRRDIYPAYKHKRHTRERTPEEKEAYDGLSLQMCELRKRYLPRIGFKNIFCCRGYESDDLMAQIAQDVPEDEEAILVTADQDLFQCLRSNVILYSPQKQQVFTFDWFRRTYGIRPWQWIKVKAIAGCHSDEVVGIKGIGEKTALRYVRGELSVTSVAYRAIRSPLNRAVVLRNRGLVCLPGPGCPKLDLVDDSVDPAGWREVCATLGMRSIASRPPIATRKRAFYANRRS